MDGLVLDWVCFNQIFFIYLERESPIVYIIYWFFFVWLLWCTIENSNPAPKAGKFPCHIFFIIFWYESIDLKTWKLQRWIRLIPSWSKQNVLFPTPEPNWGQKVKFLWSNSVHCYGKTTNIKTLGELVNIDWSIDKDYDLQRLFL